MNLSTATAPQAEAITSNDPTLLVLAGPGSGKTATTIARIRRLIDEGNDPSKIVALTFTNAAAREMEKRLNEASPLPPDLEHMQHLYPDEEYEGECRLGYIGTLHGFALRMLKQYGRSYGYGDGMSIISPDSANDLLASKAEQLGCKVRLDDLLRLKSKGRPPKGTRLDVAQTVIAAYYQDLREAGIVDFDILLSEFARMIQPDPTGHTMLEHEYTHLFVDEVQDSAQIDWDIYHALPIPNKFYVGDPDQAIYSFRGGDVGGLMALARRPGTTVIKLEANFRSHAEICEAAQHLIEHNPGRIEKATISAKGPGGIAVAPATCMNPGHENQRIYESISHQMVQTPTMEIAVLCRTNAVAYEIQQALTAAGLPVVQRAKTDLPKDWPLARSLIELVAQPNNDTLAYFYLLAIHKSRGAPDNIARKFAATTRRNAQAQGLSLNGMSLHIATAYTAIEAVAATFKENISQESRMLLAEIARELPTDATPADLAIAIASRHADVKEPAKENGIHVLTIHASKGREFDAVYLAGFEDEVTPGTKPSAAEIEEERRLAYVAITRARRFLMITCSQQRLTSWGAIASHTPSRFIAEMTS